MPRPSIAHQSLVMWAIRKMQADGYVPFAYDGRIPRFDCLNQMLRSQEVNGLRPDALGYSDVIDGFALAEAKTPDDLLSSHTKYQLYRYKLLLSASGKVRLYFATARSAAPTADRVLQAAGLHVTRSIMRLHIPDCFLAEGD